MVLWLTYIEFLSALRNSPMNKRDSEMMDDLLTYERLMNALTVSCKYQAKVFVSFSEPSHKEKISQVIVILLGKLMPMNKTPFESSQLKSVLRTYVPLCEVKEAKVSNLLVQFCVASRGRRNDFELIQMLLEVGSDPTAQDQYGNTPLQLLCENELLQEANWNNCFYSIRANSFTSIVGWFLYGRTVEEYAEYDTGLETLRYLKYHPVYYYPNSDLYEFLRDMNDPAWLLMKLIALPLCLLLITNFHQNLAGLVLKLITRSMHLLETRT